MDSKAYQGKTVRESEPAWRMDRQAHAYIDHHRDEEADHEVAPGEGAKWNPIPAAGSGSRGEIAAGSCPPISTASRLDKRNAPAEAQKPPPRLISRSAANAWPSSLSARTDGPKGDSYQACELREHDAGTRQT